MAQDKERLKVVEHVHLLIAMRRKKENRELKELCFREVIRDDVNALATLRAKVKGFPGTWRIYRTVNKRCVKKAQLLLQKKLLDHPVSYSYRIDSLWKTCLLNPTCKAERNVLLDIDKKDISLEEVSKIVVDNELDVAEYSRTPNGYHIVAHKPSVRDLWGDKRISDTHRDGLMFVEVVE